ncbi:hypothetical protein GQ600_366 [Phytophthora cactorum]|nr:hypothetical protein GQ600_366 [Phytophthora cactorum]
MPVVWYRRVDGWDVKPVTTLFFEGKCWFCLDGLNQGEINLRGYQNDITLLATSAHSIRREKEGGYRQVTCLLPFWKQVDLEDVANTFGIKDESDVAKRYFVSGGSIRDFLLPIRVAEVGIARALSRLTSESADLLLG